MELPNVLLLQSDRNRHTPLRAAKTMTNVKVPENVLPNYAWMKASSHVLTLRHVSKVIDVSLVRLLIDLDQFVSLAICMMMNEMVKLRMMETVFVLPSIT